MPTQIGLGRVLVNRMILELGSCAFTVSASGWMVYCSGLAVALMVVAPGETPFTPKPHTGLVELSVHESVWYAPEEAETPGFTVTFEFDACSVTTVSSIPELSCSTAHSGLDSPCGAVPSWL